MPKHLLKGKLDNRYYLVPLMIFAVFAVMWAFSGQWPWHVNGYNSYTLQVCAWLDGRLDLGQDYPWLELAIFDGKYYVSFPPFPSMLLLPFAAIWGTGVSESLILQGVTLVGILYAVRLFRKTAPHQGVLTFSVLFLYLANGYLFVGLTGWVWFFAQSICFTLSLMALTYAVTGRGGLSLTCWACAVGCRPMVALYLPLLLFALWEGSEYRGSFRKLLRFIQKKWYWILGPALIGGAYMVLNYLRFGNPLEFGHTYLPEFQRTPEGQFDLSYLLDNLKQLIKLPVYTADNAPLTFERYNGFAFFLTTPLFLWAAGVWGYALVKRNSVSRVQHLLFPLLVLAHLLIICCHRTLGGWQFGNRYLVDFLPYLFYGVIRSPGWSEKLCRWVAPTFCFSAALNLLGTVALFNNWI